MDRGAAALHDVNVDEALLRGDDALSAVREACRTHGLECFDLFRKFRNLSSIVCAYSRSVRALLKTASWICFSVCIIPCYITDRKFLCDFHCNVRVSFCRNKISKTDEFHCTKKNHGKSKCNPK